MMGLKRQEQKKKSKTPVLRIITSIQFKSYISRYTQVSCFDFKEKSSIIVE